MDKMPVGVRIAYHSIKEVEQAVTTSAVLSILASVDKSKTTFASDAFNLLYDFSNIAAVVLCKRRNR